jgi:hypothetical protein
MNTRFLTCTTTLIKRHIVNAAVATLIVLFIRGLCLGQVYSYTDASEGSGSVIGYGSVTGYYNSSTHVYGTTVTVTAPSGRYTTVYSGGTSVTAYLSLDFEHGNFTATTSHNGTCPYGSSHTVGGSGDSTTVTKYCSLGVPFFTGTQTPTSLKVSVTCSKDNPVSGSTSVKVESYAVEPVGSWSLQAIEDQPKDVADGESKEYTFAYEKTAQTATCPTSPPQPCSCKGEARMTILTTGVNPSGPVTTRTTASITIPPE